jgi:hypothetical protein
MEYAIWFLLWIPVKSTTGRVGGEKALAVYMSLEQLPRLLLTLLVCIERRKRPPLEFHSPSQSDFYIPIYFYLFLTFLLFLSLSFRSSSFLFVVFPRTICRSLFLCIEFEREFNKILKVISSVFVSARISSTVFMVMAKDSSLTVSTVLACSTCILKGTDSIIYPILRNELWVIVITCELYVHSITSLYSSGLEITFRMLLKGSALC